MPNLNKVMLIGNLTRDPEIRYTPKGTAVTDISLAINRNYSLDDGSKREETTYVDITYWGRQAEVIGEYMKKGRPIYVEGRLQLDQWEDKNTGQNRSRLKVVGDSFQFLGGREEGGGGGGGGYSGGGQQGGGYQQPQQAAPQQQAPQQNYQQPAPQQQAPPQQAPQQSYEQAPPQQQAPPPQQQAAPPAEEDDDIPF